VDRNRRNRHDPHDQGVRPDAALAGTESEPHVAALIQVERHVNVREAATGFSKPSLETSIYLSPVAADAIRKHGGHRKQIALHTRRHLPRGRLANPDKSRNYRQAPEHGLQSPSVQSV
jgi:hypothetical protein